MTMGKLYEFQGLMAPVFTPFSKEDYSLNLGVIPAYAKYLAENGIKGILVNGTSGEGMSMNVEERQKVTEAWKEAASSTHHNIMVQVGGAPLPDVLKLAEHADRCGVDSLLCLPDLFNKPSSVKELLEYLQLVSNAAPKTPILYYHIPAFTGVNVLITELFSEAHRSNMVPRFAGAKFTYTNLEDGATSLRVGSELSGHSPYSVFLGSDETMLGAFALGFNSAIGTTFNILPELGKCILSSSTKNNFVQGQEHQWRLTQAVRAITKHGKWVPTMKAAMNLRTKINVGPPRPPLKCITLAQEDEMKLELARILSD
ncbi:N-acetylneuraminate lyase B-like isoform X2 [Ischnura elegans]|uniref:N-acetylneuraminate lyase B-like isoform X2 n=1 Tax=Ischnura elegans TaxID=197161 RepID=UPI001ED8A27E|nr:N-acetylneuraminate lyase B-like isoform X2 [Ischnura elegans]